MKLDRLLEAWVALSAKSQDLLVNVAEALGRDTYPTTSIPAVTVTEHLTVVNEVQHGHTRIPQCDECGADIIHDSHQFCWQCGKPTVQWVKHD